MKALRQQYESDQPIFVWFDEVRSLFMIQRGGGMPIRLRIPDFNELAQLADTGFFLADKYEWKNLVETIQEDPDIERFYAVWKDDITGWTVIDADSAADKRWKHLIDEVNSQGHTGDILIKWNDDLSRWEPLADLMDHRLEDISVEWILRWRDVLKESYAIVEDADIDHDFVITSNENHYYRIKDYGIKGATHEELAHEYPAWSQVIQYMEVHGEDVTEQVTH